MAAVYAPLANFVIISLMELVYVELVYVELAFAPVSIFVLISRYEYFHGHLSFVLRLN